VTDQGRSPASQMRELPPHRERDGGDTRDNGAVGRRGSYRRPQRKEAPTLRKPRGIRE
jgi:hypothetical protein